MSDNDKTDWIEIGIIAACVVLGGIITTLFIYAVAMIQIHT